MDKEPNPLAHAFDALTELDLSKSVTVGHVIKALRRQGFGPFWLVLAFVAVTPLAAIPGAPALIGALLALFSAQLLFGRKEPWIPGRLANIEISQKRIDQFLTRATPVTRFLSRFLYPRLQFLAYGVLPSIGVAMTAIAIGVVMGILGFIPFAPFILGVPFFLLALAYTARDGLAMIVAYGVLAGCSALLYLLFRQFG